MAIKRPLVLGANARLELLQPGDELFLGVYNPHTFMFQNMSGVDLLAGTPVYCDGSSVFVSSASSSITAHVSGFLTEDTADGSQSKIQIDGIITLPTNKWNAITGQTGGLTSGSYYFLSTVGGKVTVTAPNGPANTFCLKVFRAVSSTVAEIAIGTRVKL